MSDGRLPRRLPACGFLALTCLALLSCGEDPVVTDRVTGSATAQAGGIVLTPVNRGFTAAVGGPAPPAAKVAVSSSGTQLTGLQVGTITYGAGQPTGWLGTAVLDVITTPATLTLQPTSLLSSGLPAGTYNATIPIIDPAATNTPQNAKVTLTVVSGPWIEPNPKLRNFVGTVGGAAPAPKTIAITNAGTPGSVLSGLSVSAIVYDAGQPTGWLTTASLSGTTAPATLTLRPTIGALPAGVYHAVVSIASAAAVRSPITVSVQLTVKVPTKPLIGVTPISRGFTAVVGGLAPAAKTFSITNTGIGSLSGLSIGTITYGLGEPTGWLTTASLNTTTAPATLTVRPTVGALAAGSYTAKVPIVSAVAGNSPLNVTVTFTVGSNGSGYAITLNFLTGMTPSQQAAFEAAANRWSAIITGDVQDIFIASLGASSCGANPAMSNFVVDDVLIFAEVTPIDGVGGILGQAGPCLIRGTGALPVVGHMQFDSADLANLEANGTLTDVILHEMGHVLGYGTIWSTLGLRSGAGGPDPFFTGASALAQFNLVGGSGYVGNKVPLENTGGAGTRDAHWRETVFNSELMTGFISGPGNPLSTVTAGSMGDMGYTVSFSQADGYVLGQSVPHVGAAVHLERDLLLPRFMIDPSGRVVPIRP